MLFFEFFSSRNTTAKLLLIVVKLINRPALGRFCQYVATQQKWSERTHHMQETKIKHKKKIKVIFFEVL